MKNGFFKIAAATPSLRIADPDHNASELIRLTREASDLGAALVVFPELSITGYTCGDLFRSHRLQQGALEALEHFLQETAGVSVAAVVGLPLALPSGLCSCSAVCFEGRLLGIIPKDAPAGYAERCFAHADAPAAIELFGSSVPCGRDLLFAADRFPAFCFAVEAGQALLSNAPRSQAYAAAGATLICNPTASFETVCSANKRRSLINAHSERLSVAYLTVSAGRGESTADGVMGGHRIVSENGVILAEAAPFCENRELLLTEIDVELLVGEQQKKPVSAEPMRRILFSLPESETALTRPIPPSPFIPENTEELAERCETALTVQSIGLSERLKRAYAKKAVIGISGGLDSTLALIAAARAVDLLGRPRTDIVAVTMPCFGTTKRTKSNAEILCRELGVEFRCIDIKKAVDQHFSDIGHDPSVRDVTYENCQARERTQVLMDVANDCGGMVIGTGDLSELVLGWATYNGDHMSMYGVNGGIPKTMIRYIVAHSADRAEADGNAALARALRDVLDTPVSPELLPADEKGEIAQKTEDLVGPYELHDFYLFYLIRYGFGPKKLYRMAKYALGDRYSEKELKHWLKTLLRRFFSQQFKRSCLPDGPAIGSVSLSPRGFWAMPSDASSALWLAEAEEL